jgi:ABC-2 type transport system ATP-binding protein
MADAIQLSGLTRAFKDDIVIRDISFSVDENNVLGLIGGNGSGKTTLLELMAGVLRPTLGTVKVQLSGTDLRDVYRNRHEAKKYFGFGLQSPSFYSSMTVAENVEYFASLHGMEDTSTEEYREELLTRLELHDRLKTTASRLSGGMKKRLDIACATVHQPRYIFLDEPASDLDPELRSTVWDVISWFADNGATVVFSTHYLQELQSFTDRVGILEDGRLRAIKPPRELEAMTDSTVEVNLTVSGDIDAVNVLKGKFEVINDEGPVLVRTEDVADVMKVLRDYEALCHVESIDTRRQGLESLIYE